MKSYNTVALAKKILSLSQIGSWRKAMAEKGKRIAVVLGSFDILQPGNLAAIREAKKQAENVCVLIEHNKIQWHAPHRHNPVEIRMKVVSHLEDVSAISFVSKTTEQLKELQPYTIIDCLAQPACTSVRKKLRDMAEIIVNIQPLSGCFTADIKKSIRSLQVPIRIPPQAREPLPNNVELQKTIQECRREKQPLVTVNGCFDILHIGHVCFLAQARSMGGKLIVLVNDNASVRAYKGASHPVFPIEFRIQALRALDSVSLAYPFSGDNPLKLLAKIRPDIHVKGGTYNSDRVHMEEKLLKKWGGEVKFCPMVKGYSTEQLISNMQNTT